MRVFKIVATVAVLAVASLLAACVALKTDPAAEAVAMDVLKAVRDVNEGVMRARLTPEGSAAISHSQFRQLRVYTPSGEPTRRRLINFVHRYGQTESLSLQYELTYPGEGVLYDIYLKRPKGGAWRAEYVHLQRASDAQLAPNRFTLAKPPGHWLFLALTLLSLLTMLAALVVIVRAPRFKRKWLWAILALTGLGSFSMNWSTGQVFFNPVTVALVGVGATTQGFLGFFPYIVKFTPPIGALAAFWRAAEARRAAKATPPLDETVAGA